MDSKHDILKRCFGYTDFRSGQAELIDAQLAGRDVFGIMPTGGGKSICYQIPALLADGITVVISPLISLMKDQVAALKKAGIAAAYINSSLSSGQMKLVYKNILLGKYKIIYVAPERLLAESFLSVIRRVKTAMVTVDEAHCISQWGQDFRPGYLKIVEFLRLLEHRPVVSAFTATATRQVREDVERILQLQNPLRVITGFDRPNLRYEVIKPKNKPAALEALISARRGKSGIVYCTTRKDVEKVCLALQSKGFSATRYHAGLDEDERRVNQDDFVYDRRSIMVATNAFGMGIDKSNVAYVIHYNMPGSLEAYYQEAGRAGRDGAPADCILLFSPGDIETAKFLIQQPPNNEELPELEHRNVVEQDLARLDVMIGYCKTHKCLRGYILDYFEQTDNAMVCENCGNCSATFTKKNITTEAKMILSCARRIRDRLGYSLGETLLVHVLHGSGEKRVVDLQLNELSTYGLMSSISRSDIREIIDSLREQGYLQIDIHKAVVLTARANAVLFHGEEVEMTVKASKEPPARKSPEIADADLLSALKELRSRIAASENVPAYIIFSNASLQDMAAKAPMNADEFLEVSGVGKYKAARYSEPFLAEIAKFKKTSL